MGWKSIRKVYVGSLKIIIAFNALRDDEMGCMRPRY